MSIKYGDARMLSLKDKINEQRERELIKEATVVEQKVEEVKVVKKGRRLNK